MTQNNRQLRLAHAAERRARTEAEAAIRTRDEFLSIAAHELKTPVTSLLASAQLMVRRVQKGEPLEVARVRERVELIGQQATKLSRLVSQLLDISRLEAGKLALEWRPTDLTALVKGVVAGLQVDPAKHRLVVRVSGRPIALLDPLRIEQVLINLLDNALRFSPPGGAIEVENSTPHDSQLRLAVRDNGIGIPPDKRDQIFERFYQAHDQDHRSGLGLGLYISRQIVELHGGSITAEFPPEGGVRFVVTLPTGTDPTLRLTGEAAWTQGNEP